MKSTDLRIGNWVWLMSRGKYYMLQDGHDIDEGCDSDDIEPIPLTEDILLKCGFKKVEDIQQDYSYVLNLKARLKIVYYLGDLNCASIFQDGKLIDLAHGIVCNLHSLQNLIHSLTNEELTINL